MARLSSFVDLKYTSDLHIQNIYDLETLRPIDKRMWKSIFDDNDLYFHATPGCSAVSIIKNGFKLQKEITDVGIEMHPQYFGEGIYFAEHIEKSLMYGDYVFVNYIKFEDMNDQQIEIIPPMDHPTFLSHRR